MHQQTRICLHVADPRANLIVSVALAAALPGCGPSGPERFPVSGEVTYRGEPVPGGVIFFDPDVAAGNNGLQGFAEIRDGRYDTRVGSGKGVTGGAYVLRVRGFDDNQPSPQPLFGEQEIRVEFDQTPNTYNINVSAGPANDQPPAEFVPT